jgi:hypothetical protein
MRKRVTSIVGLTIVGAVAVLGGLLVGIGLAIRAIIF